MFEYSVIEEWLNYKNPDFDLRELSKKITIETDYDIFSTANNKFEIIRKEIERLDPETPLLSKYIHRVSKRLNTIQNSYELPPFLEHDMFEALLIVKDIYNEYSRFTPDTTISEFQTKLNKVKGCMDKISNKIPYIKYINDTYNDDRVIHEFIGLYYSSREGIMYELRIYQKLFLYIINDLKFGVQNDAITSAQTINKFYYKFYNKPEGIKAMEKCYEYLVSQDYLDPNINTLDNFKNILSKNTKAPYSPIKLKCKCKDIAYLIDHGIDNIFSITNQWKSTVNIFHFYIKNNYKTPSISAITKASSKNKTANFINDIMDEAINILKISSKKR